MSYTTLDVHRDGTVGWLVFDRPDRGNAIDAVMFEELERAWAELDADPDVRVIGTIRSRSLGGEEAQLTKRLAARLTEVIELPPPPVEAPPPPKVIEAAPDDEVDEDVDVVARVGGRIVGQLAAVTPSSGRPARPQRRAAARTPGRPPP